MAAVTSDCNLEQPRDEMELANNLTDAYPPGLPLPNRMHRFVTLDRAVGSPERAETLARSYPPLDGPMILLQDVIKVLHRPQSTSTPQHPFCLKLFNDWRVGRILIHIDDSRRWVVRRTQCLLKEPLGCCCIVPGGEQKIDAGTGRVHRSIQVRPFAFYADVSFIDTPALVSRLQV